MVKEFMADKDMKNKVLRKEVGKRISEAKAKAKEKAHEVSEEKVEGTDEPQEKDWSTDEDEHGNKRR